MRNNHKRGHLFYSFWVRMLAVAIFLFAFVSAQAEKNLSPEIRAEIDKIYAYNFTDMQKSLTLLKQMQSAGKLEPHVANEIMGDLYYNRGNFFESMKYYKRGLYDDRASGDTGFQQKVISKLLMCFDNNHNLAEMNRYAQMLKRLSADSHDAYMQSVVLFNEGKIAHTSGDVDKSYKMLRQAIALAKKSSKPEKYSDVYYYYITLIEMMQDDRRNGLPTISELEAYVKSSQAKSGSPFSAKDTRWQADIDIHKTLFLLRAGRGKEAEQCYDNFLKSKEAFSYDYLHAVEYLTEAGRWDDIISLWNRIRPDVIDLGEEPYYDLCQLYRRVAEAYDKTGRRDEAITTFRQLGSLQSAFRHSEEQSAISEITNNYEKKAEAIEQERALAKMRQNEMIVIVLVIVAAGALLLIREKRNAALILKKNQRMAKYIEELQKKESAQGLTPEKSGTDNDEMGKNDVDTILYRRLYDKLVRHQLFLDPNLSRDKLLEELNIPKNKFAQLFKKFAGTNYAHFVNDLRLDHACTLLRLHPNHTIEAVAHDCGFSSTSTLYTLFYQKYGMTPNEYRKAVETDKND